MNAIAVIVSFAVLATASGGIVGAPVAVAPAPVVGAVAIAPQPLVRTVAIAQPQPLVRTVAIAQPPLIAQPAFRPLGLAPPAFIQPGFGAVRLAPQGLGGFGFPQYGAVTLAQPAYRPVAAPAAYGLGYTKYY